MTIVKVVKTLIIAVCMMPALGISQTENKTNLNIGFVNIRQLMAEAPQISQTQKILTKEFEKENKKVIEIRNKIDQLNKEFDSKSVDNEIFIIQKKIEIKQRELGRLQTALQDEYSLKRNEELGKLQSLIVEIVAKVSRDKKLDIVLNNTGVIYVNTRIDITADVMSRLNSLLVK